MANNAIINGIPVDLAADNGKIPVLNTSTRSWEMTTPSSGGGGTLIYRDVFRPVNSSSTTDQRWSSTGTANGGVVDVTPSEGFSYTYLSTTATDGLAIMTVKFLGDFFWENLRDGPNWTDFQYKMDTVMQVEIRALGAEDSVFTWGFGRSTFLGESGFSGSNYACFSIVYDTDGFYLKARTVSDTGTVQNTTITAITLDVITTKFLTILLTSTSVEFYVDGVLEATHTGDIPNDTTNFPCEKMSFGVSANGSNNEGDNIRIGSINYEIYKV